MVWGPLWNHVAFWPRAPVPGRLCQSWTAWKDGSKCDQRKWGCQVWQTFFLFNRQAKYKDANTALALGSTRYRGSWKERGRGRLTDRSTDVAVPTPLDGWTQCRLVRPEFYCIPDTAASSLLASKFRPSLLPHCSVLDMISWYWLLLSAANLPIPTVVLSLFLLTLYCQFPTVFPSQQLQRVWQTIIS